MSTLELEQVFCCTMVLGMQSLMAVSSSKFAISLPLSQDALVKIEKDRVSF
jgi:hypothetical protein